MKDLYTVAMDLCRVRDALEPIRTGMIRKGHASNGDIPLEPGLRKTKLKDAKQICDLKHAHLNGSINLILEHEKLYRRALEMLERWIVVLRRGDMGDISPVMDEIFDTEDLIKEIRAGFIT